MKSEKFYLMAEFQVKPERLDETKAIFAELLPTVLKEPGCEAMFTTSAAEDPNRLVFFEVFTSEEAHQWHMEQSYTQKLAVDLEGKLAAAPKVMRLVGF